MRLEPATIENGSAGGSDDSEPALDQRTLLYYISGRRVRHAICMRVNRKRARARTYGTPVVPVVRSGPGGWWCCGFSPFVFTLCWSCVLVARSFGAGVPVALNGWRLWSESILLRMAVRKALRSGRSISIGFRFSTPSNIMCPPYAPTLSLSLSHLLSSTTSSLVLGLVLWRVRPIITAPLPPARRNVLSVARSARHTNETRQCLPPKRTHQRRFYIVYVCIYVIYTYIYSPYIAHTAGTGPCVHIFERWG